ncbi:sensor histidine kinase [Bacillus sp. 31A1R]|uniref:histidine kinase n=1 Tax=Robertmurraya mangrovi TaxID=3098077 RepID=A0ABU5J2G0_9BACI|nr:sensor histidine kinase [Bacillus sp. 31A1R]MDZ5473589.1 sensor histidine kinase [Bacillus sp. 31A1R]
MKKKGIEIFPKRFGFFPYIFLVYLCMPAYYISAQAGLKMALGFLLLALFLVTYRQLYFSMDKKVFTYWLILQVAIILVLSVSYNLYNLFLGFFPANFIGWYSDRKKFSKILVLFGLAIISPLILQLDNLSTRELFYFIPFIIIMLISPFGIRSMNSRMELERKLDEANEQIKMLVKREERMRIARDLHDTLGHTLSLITLKSQLVGKLVSKDPDRAKKEALEMERTSRSALAQVRELVSDMRTITVAEELIEVEHILDAAGISYELKGDTQIENVPYLTQNILSMCLREGITNVVKHSEASKCSVEIRNSAGEVNLVIEDNGKGLDQSQQDGNGLKGMKERLELIDGSMKLQSTQVTSLIIKVPVIMKQRETGEVS